jgi:hypothetical protein
MMENLKNGIADENVFYRKSPKITDENMRIDKDPSQTMCLLGVQPSPLTRKIQNQGWDGTMTWHHM